MRHVRVGVIGGGQLGRMLALAGYPLGMSTTCLDPSPDAPAGQVGPLIVGEYGDPAALQRLAEVSDVITYEFENVPASIAEALVDGPPIHPPDGALRVAQDRLREKEFFSAIGAAVPAFRAVDSRDELARAADELGLPAVLKTRRMGYDGKGQLVLRSAADIEPAWAALGGTPLILERFVRFDRELSVLAVRSTRGETAIYPLVENQHQQGILRRSVAPARDVAPEVIDGAQAIAMSALERLQYAGVLAIELFEVDREVMANEMAPRVHNSGHWTIEGAETSQFENHLRAIAGLPLGSTAPRGAAGMVNIIGEMPEPFDVLRVPGAHLHLYGKAARPGRKLGHVTVRADSWDELSRALARVEQLAPCRLAR